MSCPFEEKMPELFLSAETLFTALQNGLNQYQKKYKPSNQGKARSNQFFNELKKLDIQKKPAESLLKMELLIMALFQSTSTDFSICIAETIISGEYRLCVNENEKYLIRDGLSSPCVNLSMVRQNIMTHMFNTDEALFMDIDKKNTLNHLIKSDIKKNKDYQIELDRLKTVMEPRGYEWYRLLYRAITFQQKARKTQDEIDGLEMSVRVKK